MFKLISKCSETFCGETACVLRVLLENFISAAVTLDLPCSFSAQVSLPYSRMDIANVLLYS
jgi:hypothetical protein